MKHILLLLVLFGAVQSFAQKNSDIKGFLTDTTDSPLIGASAILYFKKDSVLTGFGLTDETGKFQINSVAPGEYYLQLSYVGYHSVNKTFVKDDFKGEIDLGRVALSSNTDIEAVVVTNAPLEVRKDTLVYDAAAFQTKQNATIEDLLKKLPGIEVEDDGSIKAQGEEVQNVLVDGKKFFGDDPKIATQNLPAEAVKNIEVYDKKSEKAEFTGVDDGEEEKTLNIELKEDHKSGYFGNIKAGGGVEDNRNDGLYTGKALISRFSPSNQLSVIASSNNVNDRAFTFRDYFAMSGQSFGGRGRGARSITVNSNSLLGGQLASGINRSTVAGANWNKPLSEKVELHTDYFYNATNTDFARDITREYFQNAGGLNYTQNTNGDDDNQNHRLNLDLTAKLNKKNELKFENQFVFANSDSQSYEESVTRSQTGELSNNNQTSNNTDGENFAISTDLFWKHRFKKEGRSLFTNFGFKNTTTDQTQRTNANTYFAESNLNNLLNQDLVNDYKINSWKGDLSYTEPIKENHYLELNYLITNDTENRQQDFYDISSGARVLDNELTNGFDRDYLVNRPTVNYKIMGEKHDFTFGAGYETAKLDGATSLTSTNIDRSFTQFLPSFSWSYEIKDGKNLRVNYFSRQNAPSVNQLQPAVNNTDPLNIYTGNPNLEAETIHSVYSNFFSFDRFSFTNFFVNLGATHSANNIINAQTFDANGVQTTMPINVDGQTNVNANADFGKPIRAIRMRLRTGLGVNFTDGILFLNGVENDYTRWSNSIRLNLDNTNNEKFDYSVGVRLSDNTTKYSQNEDNNQDYLNQFYSVDFEYRGLENWRFGTEFDHSIYGQATARSSSQEFSLLEASISRLFANDLGEIKLSAYDLLNQNTGISQTQNLNYVQEEISNALGRYGMLTFTWKIMNGSKNSKGANSEPPRGDGPPPPAKDGGNPPPLPKK